MSHAGSAPCRHSAWRLGRSLPERPHLPRSSLSPRRRIANRESARRVRAKRAELLEELQVEERGHRGLERGRRLAARSTMRSHLAVPGPHSNSKRIRLCLRAPAIGRCLDAPLNGHPVVTVTLVAKHDILQCSAIGTAWQPVSKLGPPPPSPTTPPAPPSQIKVTALTQQNGQLASHCTVMESQRNMLLQQVGPGRGGAAAWPREGGGLAQSCCRMTSIDGRWLGWCGMECLWGYFRGSVG